MAREAMQSEPSRPVSGLGPHGEFPAPPDELRLSAAAAERIAASRFSVAVVLHSLSSDWSQLQLAGIRTTLERYGASLVDVIECGFQSATQIAAIEPLLEQPPDAIISIPVDTLRSADVHRRISEADVKLVLMDNAPIGMVARKDYVSVVSADNFGNGEIAAEILADHVMDRGTVLIAGYGVDFPVTNERELGFSKWLGERRPDIHISRVEFADPEEAGNEVALYLGQRPAPHGLFAVWDRPALLVLETLRAAGLEIPMATVDLGMDIAREIARGGPVKGGGAQLPFDQGVAEATAAIMALAGDEPPPWIALPAMAVTRQNVVEAYRTVWHEAPPGDLVDVAPT
jgi:ribose transport system substrate-binding protein